MRMSSSTSSGFRRAARFERVDAVAGLAGELDAVDLGEKRGQALARQGFVVNYECFHGAVGLASGRRTVTVYSPLPGSTRSSPRLPKWYSMRARMFASATPLRAGAASGGNGLLIVISTRAGQMAAGDADRAAIGERLHAVIDRVLDQRLQQEARQRQIARQIVGLDIDVQAIAEAQLFDAQVVIHQVELFAERARCLAAAERGAEKIGEILDRALGLGRARADQARDRVHAVEEEMRADARLQRVDLRLRCGLDAFLPELEHEEVAQQRRRDQRRDRRVAEHETQIVAGRAR